MKLDRWDFVGAAGALLIGSGIWGLVGAWWAAVFWGLCLLGCYVVHEVRG